MLIGKPDKEMNELIAELTQRMTELLHDKTSEPVRLLIQPRLIPGASVQHA